jgi:hypothetical protein
MILQLYIGFMLFLGGGCLEGCRRLIRRDRIARGERT